jgi:3-phenylpropionate/trans-cinnamate dioxygenase ferredoxin subunit
MRKYFTDDTEILIVNVDNRFFGLAARCTHAGAPLVEGDLQGEVLICPWHGSRFRVTDGSVLKGPTEEALRAYPVTMENGYLFVQL